jgi:hypothetical protein
MHNAPHDLRDYILDELNPAQQAEVEHWLVGSPEGRKEVERLRLTFGVLRSLPDEEPPRRIAFVSDKIFEPSPWARLARWFWAEGPRMAMGAAAILAVLFAGAWLTQPKLTANADGWTVAFGPQQQTVAQTPAPVPAPPAVDEAVLEAKVQEAVTAERERMREALQQIVDERARATEAKFSNELEGTRQDLESAFYIINSKYEQLLKDSNAVAVAR